MEMAIEDPHKLNSEWVRIAEIYGIPIVTDEQLAEQRQRATDEKAQAFFGGLGTMLPESDDDE